MTRRNRRYAERIEVGMAAQLYTTSGFLDARVCDLSRTGLRLRVLVSDLGLDVTDDLAAAAEAVATCLEGEFALDLDYKKLGPLLQRGVNITRIGIPESSRAYVEICCAFDEALDDETATMLGADLPELQEVTRVWMPERPAYPDSTGVATLRPMDELKEPTVDPTAEATPASIRHRYRVLLRGTSAEAPPTFFCHTDLVSAVGVRVRIPRPDSAADVLQASKDLIEVHGKTVDLRILDEEQDVWTGRGRVTKVELPTSREDMMLVTLTYEAPLSMHALRRLGLVAA